MISYQQRCGRCKKNFVMVSRGAQFVTCYPCQKAEMSGEIKDPKMKKMFNIPEELYIKNAFLRDIKIKYLRFGSLSDKQIETFKKVAKELKEKKKEEKNEP
jgi:hypothetical protein